MTPSNPMPFEDPNHPLKEMAETFMFGQAGANLIMNQEPEMPLSDTLIFGPIPLHGPMIENAHDGGAPICDRSRWEVIDGPEESSVIPYEVGQSLERKTQEQERVIEELKAAHGQALKTIVTLNDPEKASTTERYRLKTLAQDSEIMRLHDVIEKTVDKLQFLYEFTMEVNNERYPSILKIKAELKEALSGSLVADKPTSVCAFCGHVGPRTPDEMATHAMDCEKHPIRSLVGQVATLKELLVRAMVSLQEYEVWALISPTADLVNKKPAGIAMDELPQDIQDAIIEIRVKMDAGG